MTFRMGMFYFKIIQKLGLIFFFFNKLQIERFILFQFTFLLARFLSIIVCIFEIKFFIFAILVLIVYNNKLLS